MRRRSLFTTIAFVGAELSIWSVTEPVRAAPVVNVNTTADTPPGTCATSGTGTCTLREAVIYGNANPGTTINLPAGTYNLTQQDGSSENAAMTGDLDIHVDMTIVGAGAHSTFIDGQKSMPLHDRVFDIFSNGPAPYPAFSVAISGVTIRNGRARDAYGGGAIWSALGANVTITDSVVRDNVSDSTRGGAIVSDGSTDGASLTVIRSDVRANTAAGTNPAGTAYGGAIDALDTSVTIIDSRLYGNTLQGAPATNGDPGRAALGGAVSSRSSDVVMVNSLVVLNFAIGGTAAGGGGSEQFAGGSGGGGLFATEGGDVTVVNSTFDNNVSAGGSVPTAVTGFAGRASGGGLYLNAPATLIGNTIAHNVAQAGSGPTDGTNPHGGGVFISTQELDYTNNIIAANIVTPTEALAGVDVYHSFVTAPSGGHNLIGVLDPFSPKTSTDISGTPSSPLDPKLATTVVNNGGFWETLALLPGSPAAGAGDDSVCAAPLPPAPGPNGSGGVDQRGVHRPQPAGGHCDIGAFEFQYQPSTTVLTSSSNPAALGESVTLTATVSANGTPTGSVTLKDGGASIGGGSLAGGVVTVTTAALSEGVHSITAEYSGDGTFAPSSFTLSQVVGNPPLQFFPLAHPVRLLDTRPDHAALVHTGAPLTPNVPILLPGQFTIGDVTVPAAAQALVGNATVDNSDGAAAGFATLWPSGSTLPLASNLNFIPGTVRPNSFTVGLGGDGQFNLQSNTGGHFIIDITGYYAPPAAGGLYFHPLAQPVRLLDTRGGASAVVHPDAPLTAGQTLNLPGRFTAGATTVPTSALALAGNATVDNTVNAPPGFATLFPGDTPLPPTSNLNFAAGTIAPNAFTVGLGADGSFNLYSNSGGNFVIDITGYYDNVPTDGLLLHALPRPVRELDTRPAHSAAVRPGTPLAPGGTLNLPGPFTHDGVSVPDSASALVGNATVDNTSNAPPDSPRSTRPAPPSHSRAT